MANTAFNIGPYTPYSSTPALSGIQISSVPPADGQVLTFDAATNQFVYTDGGSGSGSVDLTSAQTITGEKTFTAPALVLGPSTVISQGGNSFSFPAAGGTLATVPTGAGNEYVDLQSAQTITGDKTFSGTSLTLGASTVLAQGSNTFALPAASGTLATVPTGVGNEYVDLQSAQTITGNKTFSGASVTLGASTVLAQGANTFALPAASGTLATVPAGAGNAIVDLQSAQTITGNKTFSGTSLTLGATTTLAQGANTFALPATSGTLALAPTGAGNGYVDITSNQTITGNKTIANTLIFGTGATITSGSFTYTFPSHSGQLVAVGTTNTFVGVSSGNAINTGTNNTSLGYRTFESLTNGDNNVAIGFRAANAITSGIENIAIGTDAFKVSINGNANTLIGLQSGQQLSSGQHNIGVGNYSLWKATTGSDNTAIGYSSGSNILTTAGGTCVGAYAMNNTTDTTNTAMGYQAIRYATSGASNTAIGYRSMMTTTTGSNNTAIGYDSLKNTTTASSNVAIGTNSMQNATAGNNNTAVGFNSLNATSSDNSTAVGSNALNVATGTANTAIGSNALMTLTTGTGNVAIGRLAGSALLTGADNVLIGRAAGSGYNGAETNNIIIGVHNGAAGESNTMRIGGGTTAFYLAGVYGATVGGTNVPMLIDSNGKVGTSASSRRFKDNIFKARDYNIRPLQVVNFTYKSDPTQSQQVGLIAEDVETVIPELVVRNGDGEVQTVRYADLIPILLMKVQQLESALSDANIPIPPYPNYVPSE